MDVTWLLLVLTIALAAIYYLLTRRYNYWQRQNVPCLPDPIPGFGHAFGMLALKENIPMLVNRLYQSTDASMIGFYLLQRPCLVVRDPELVKSVLQTNFASFHNNFLTLNEEADPVLAKNPFFTTDLDGWKVARTRTTSYLSGKKLRSLFNILSEVLTTVVVFTDRKIQENGGEYECEMKAYFVRCTGEFIANSAFAIEGQSFEDKPDPLAFTNVAKTVFAPTFFNGIKQSLLFYTPTLARILKIGFMQRSTDEYFRQNIRRILKERQAANIAPMDYLQFCLDANGDDMDRVIADIITFYGDVYEASSTTMGMIFYQLSLHKDIQDKLRKHIAFVLQETNGVVTYESLKNMDYLQQVINESMRYLAPAGALMKLCTQNITLRGSDGLTVDLRPDDPIFIPVTGLQRDPRYWPEPDTFDPERFSSENQVNVKSKGTFLAFGDGPRVCVGMRLGYLLVKAVVAALIMKFEIEPSEKTKKPLDLEPTSFLTHIKGGVWTKFKKLSQENVSRS